MRRRTGDLAIPCRSCGRPTLEPRTGLCQGCYLRGYRNLTLGSECAICETRDLRVLRRVTMAAAVSTLCANDAAILGRRKITLTELRAEVFPARDRRKADRRRGDRRVPVERRTRVDVDKLLEDERRKGRRR